jgi:hypothetical protein
MRGGLGGGGLAAALGLDPDRAKTVMASLAGGLSNVKNSPFAGQVAANAAGGAIAGGNKAEDTAINQALKLQQINQRGGTRGIRSMVIDEKMRRAAQADREGTLAQARDAVTRDPGKRAAIIGVWVNSASWSRPCGRPRPRRARLPCRRCCATE